jgi:hypothetical protein
MEIISMSLKTFNELGRRMEAIEAKAERLHRNQADLRLKRWLDNEEVCETLAISKRTLQSYRENNLLPFSRIRHKIFYRPEDVQKVLESCHHTTPQSRCIR